MASAVPMQTRLTAAYPVGLEQAGMRRPVGSADVTQDSESESIQLYVVGEPELTHTEPRLAEPMPPTEADEPAIQRIEPRETATADKSASSPRFGRWIMLSMIALIGSFYLLTDDLVMYDLQQELGWAHDIEELREARAPAQQMGLVAAPEE